jgi:uracil-DNA glycosylase
MATSPHFCKGEIAVAFVFSVPGDEERRQGRPVAGDTGTNLELALGHLHSALPILFQSVHRYDYRITNAWPEPLAKRRGDRTSEGSDAQIRHPGNVRRVLLELEGCNLVVLSGNKAKLLAEAIGRLGQQYVEVPHVGNKALNGRYAVPVRLASATPAVRREYRVRRWANEVVQAITSEHGV